MEHEWSWKDMTAAAPFIATSFAFAFNVGYFWSIDIGWFSLFSLSEHVVFALRALPVAIGASIVFMIGLNFAQLESRFKWLIPFPYQIDFAMYGNDVMDLTSAGLRSM